MSLWDTVTGWIDTGVDWVAEALDYEDIVEIGTGEEFTAGQQFARDVGDFFDSDTFGFIKKGAGAYLKAQGTGGKGQTPLIQQTKFVNRRGGDFRTSRAMTQTSPISGNPVNIGYNNPDVRSALTALAQNSYNQQMNNMFSQYLVRPTKGIGTKTIGLGTTQVKGISRKSRKITERS